MRRSLSVAARLAATGIAFMILSGCATQAVGPRTYLDEETAATVTVVSEPWIFTGELVAFAAKDRDYLNLFAVDINRQGEHRQYLAALVSTPPPALTDASTLTLELQGDGKTVALQPTTTALRELGVSKPLSPSYSSTARWWYFPVGKDVLGSIMRAKDLAVTLATPDKRMTYTMWRNGGVEVGELTAVLP